METSVRMYQLADRRRAEVDDLDRFDPLRPDWADRCLGEVGHPDAIDFPVEIVMGESVAVAGEIEATFIGWDALAMRFKRRMREETGR